MANSLVILLGVVISAVIIVLITKYVNKDKVSVIRDDRTKQAISLITSTYNDTRLNSKITPLPKLSEEFVDSILDDMIGAVDSKQDRHTNSYWHLLGGSRDSIVGVFVESIWTHAMSKPMDNECGFSMLNGSVRANDRIYVEIILDLIYGTDVILK